MASQKLPTSHMSTTFNPQVNWVPKFKGENYDQWSLQMKSIFIAQGIWDIIQDCPEIPNDDDEEASWDETKQESYNLNMRRDHYALSIIHRGVDETIFPKIMDATTAKESWSILETKYKKLIKTENNLPLPICDADGDGDVDVEYCIYKVPEYFKKGKEEFYRPKVISIGPVFYNDPNLQAMQELKRFYLQRFLEDPDNTSKSLKPYKDFVRWHEKKIRERYQEQISLSSDDFIEMIVLDAAFLIYFFRLFNMSRSTHHPPLDILYKKLGVAHHFLHTDLLLEENQMPFFVLTGIYDIAFPRDLELNQTYCPFIDLAVGSIDYLSACYFSCEITNGGSNNTLSKDNIKSLVHLQIKCCYSPFDSPPQNFEAGQFLEFGSAKYLSALGVKFKLNISDDPFKISFDKRTGVLKIPQLTLYDESEDLFRSILFFEQSNYDQEVKYFSDFLFFIHKLIHTVEDIQILQHNGLLVNHLGSNEDAANLFNKLTKNTNIVLDNKFTYSEVSKSLKHYSSKPWNVWKALLSLVWRKYVNDHPWVGISVTYAVILLILTVIQTISGFTSK